MTGNVKRGPNIIFEIEKIRFISMLAFVRIQRLGIEKFRENSIRASQRNSEKFVRDVFIGLCTSSFEADSR